MELEEDINQTEIDNMTIRLIHATMQELKTEKDADIVSLQSIITNQQILITDMIARIIALETL